MGGGGGGGGGMGNTKNNVKEGLRANTKDNVTSRRVWGPTPRIV